MNSFLIAVASTVVVALPSTAESLSGKLHLRIAEQRDGGSKEVFSLVDSDGVDHLLIVPEKLRAGALLALRQPLVDIEVAAVAGSGASSVPRSALIEIRRATGPQRAAATTDSALVGNHTIAVIILNVARAGQTLASVLTRDDMVAMLVTGRHTIDGVYQASSWGQFGFDADADGDTAPDIFGPYTVDDIAHGCEAVYGWASESFPLAAGDGFNPNRYDHVVFILPDGEELGCEWGGLGELPGKYSWITSSYKSYGLESFQIIAHELGHNLGLDHASNDYENDGAVQGVDEEYGDWSCIMSNGWHPKVFNAAHHLQLGWFNPYPDAVRVVEGAGRYSVTLAPLEISPADASAPQVVRIPLTGRSDSLVLSFRADIGTFAQVPYAYTTGVNITRDQGLYRNTLLLAQLADGETFTDAASGIRIAQLSHTAGLVNFVVETSVSAGSSERIRTVNAIKKTLAELEKKVVSLRKESNPAARLRLRRRIEVLRTSITRTLSSFSTAVILAIPGSELPELSKRLGRAVTQYISNSRSPKAQARVVVLIKKIRNSL